MNMLTHFPRFLCMQVCECACVCVSITPAASSSAKPHPRFYRCVLSQYEFMVKAVIEQDSRFISAVVETALILFIFLFVFISIQVTKQTGQLRFTWAVCHAIISETILHQSSEVCTMTCWCEQTAFSVCLCRYLESGGDPLHAGVRSAALPGGQ